MSDKSCRGAASFLAGGCVLALVLCGQGRAAQPAFKDKTAELGLELANSTACWVDVDNDGWADLCDGAGVWKNAAGKKFSRLAADIGPVVAADFDNDGFADLFSWATMTSRIRPAAVTGSRCTSWATASR